MDTITRYSKQREAIINLLRSTKTHPSAEWLYNNLKGEFEGIGIATVYRNLKLFEEQGLVQKIDVGDGADHYDADMSEHYHFFCQSCGSIIDLYAPPIQLCSILPDGFTAKRHQLTFYGVCDSCQKEQCS